MSELALQLIEENKRTKNPFLDLGTCGLENHLPEELYDCSQWLKELNLGRYYLDTNNHKWVESQNTKIDNTFNGKDLKLLSKFINLKSLYLGGCQIKGISFLQNLFQLEILDLFDNKIQDISSLIKLKNLKLLDISANQIIDCRYLEKLIDLQELHLSHNTINNSGFLEKLINLKRLNLSSTKIQDISSLEKLTSLKELYLRKTDISDYNYLTKLENLQSLDISSNGIQDISFLERLINLEELSLHENNITSCDSLKELKDLQLLDLSVNKIKGLGFLQKLTKLETLNLSKNQIQDVQPLLPLLKKGLEIDLTSQQLERLEYKIGLMVNPINTPSLEIVKQGREAVINWFDSLEQQGEEMVYEAKLMVIGDAGSGKTSLATKIKDLNAKLPEKIDDTTVGIEITESFFKAREDKPNFKVNIWDLGGQKIYHPLHQLFFTSRSLYVLVSDGRNDTDENDLTDFWIPAQKLLGKESPMLILFNKHGDIQPNIAFRSFQSQYPNIKGDLAVVDLLNDKAGTSDFIAEIEKYIRNLPQFVKGEKLPKLWAKIREAIHERKESHISLPEFRSLCNKEGIEEIKKQDFLSDYLHDLGIILRFREDALLNKTVFLNPQWALDAIYKVLDHTRKHNNGLFSKSELLSVWQKPEFYDVQDELLALMLKFELCYKIDAASEQYLVPGLLPKDIPVGFKWEKEKSICLYYEYDFMPKGIISRLIVRLNHLIDKNKLLWREGVVFESNGTSAWLTRPNKNRIEIYAKGYKPSYLITLITGEIDEINSKYHFSEQSIPVKYVPCICETCKTSKKPAYYDYEKLVRRDQLGKKTIECENPPYHEVNVKALLENVESKEFAGSKSTKKVFISYSKADEDYKAELVGHLSPLKNQIAVFDDRQIALGDQWREEIQQQIDTCDYFVCLVSVGFLNTAYIHDEEIPRAIMKGKKIILVIIKPCVWHTMPIKDSDLTLGDINAHNKATVIGVEENDKSNPEEYTKTERDAMWVKVVEAILELVEKGN